MKTWDIFCRVIDNFGDIGVCWRLSRQLAAEHNQHVRLWVDDLHSLIRIWPAALDIDEQQLAGVEVRRWTPEFCTKIQVVDVVIEAFACDIPASYIDAMAEQKRAGHAPIWINLEYLSAEKWVEDCHRMQSPHPATGLRKTFFFPGFSPRTGGLLRENNLLRERDLFVATDWLKQIGVVPQPGALLVSLFAYENPAVTDLLEACKNSDKQIHCLVPAGKILTSINQSLGKQLSTGDIYSKGNLYLQVIPFLTQLEYDYLLWACDINFVRGEDSFVRAQWAAKPLIWHIYPQEEDAHIIKLSAFLDAYLAAGKDQLPDNIRELWLSWNRNGDISNSWNTLVERLPTWQQHAQDWCDLLANQPDLASQLVDLSAVWGR
ncbi:MAG: elongation factor P maturation arginine rhamnosyltransferase EarP [Cellvibrio sp.]|uniref:elongation factor P maturation arginine rhamnosyltransferase EarP n=1 Tax=Cellvibrio sp. TaxID=1965322 RepID=UPI0031A47FD4